MIKRSKKIVALEKQRFSILTKDLTRCYLCRKPKEQLHEIYFGKNRVNSMKWGCVAPLCRNCHVGNHGVHNNNELDLILKRKCQKKFIEIYPGIDFISIFHKNYI